VGPYYSESKRLLGKDYSLSFDFNNGGNIKAWNWVEQHTNWRYKFGYFKGYYFVKRHLPWLYKLLENNVEKKFEQLLNEIKPDVVQSLVMYNSCVPIFPVMQKHKQLKWIYSAWGNDLFYYRNVKGYREDILKVLPRIDYMFADCKRDINIAKELGFKGRVLGVFPGGGGYHLEHYSKYEKTFDNRKVILVKGYEQRFGKAMHVIKALINIKTRLEPFKVVVFGADEEFYSKYDANLAQEFIEVRGHLKHDEVLKLMGESLIYIGNSESDGMPNTLLEAIIMGVFPIQSNPGGATAEIIKDDVNGKLIQDCESIIEIETKILEAISDKQLLKDAMMHNKALRPELGYKKIQRQVMEQYNSIEID